MVKVNKLPALRPRLSPVSVKAYGQVTGAAVVDGLMVSALAWPDHPSWMRAFMEVLRAKAPATSRRSARLSGHDGDRAADTRDGAQPGVGGEHAATEQLGQGDVGGVVDRQVFAQLQHPGQQREHRAPLAPEAAQDVQGGPAGARLQVLRAHAARCVVARPPPRSRGAKGDGAARGPGRSAPGRR